MRYKYDFKDISSFLPVNTLFILINGQSKTLFSLILIFKNRIVSANLFAEIILLLGIYMSFTAYDSGRLFYLRLLEKNDKYIALRNYIMRNLAINIVMLFSFIFVFRQLNFSITFSILIFLLIISEKIFDEYQRFLITVINEKAWLNIIKRKSISLFLFIGIISCYVFFDLPNDNLLVLMGISALTLSNIFSFLNSYFIKLVNSYFAAILKSIINYYPKNGIDVKQFFGFMHFGGANGGLMMSLEPIVSSFGSQWVKLVLFLLMPDIKYAINLAFTFSGGVETYFASESLIPRRKKFLQNAIEQKSPPRINNREKIVIIFLSIFASLVFYIFISDKVSESLLISKSSLFFLIFFLWSVGLSIGNVIKSWETAWLHYRYPGLQSILIVGICSLFSLGLISINLIDSIRQYNLVFGFYLIAIIFEIIIIRSNFLKQFLELLIIRKKN